MKFSFRFWTVLDYALRILRDWCHLLFRPSDRYY